MAGSQSARTAIRLVIPSEIRLLDLVHSASEHIAQLAGFDSDQALNVGMAVRETVINAILHGNKQDPKRRVDITFEANGQGIKATVCDQGDGFDPNRTSDPTAEENLLATSGRGLLMVRAYVDDVDFRFRKGRGMEVILVKRMIDGGSDG